MSLKILSPKAQPALFYDQLFLNHFVMTQQSPTGAKTVDMVVTEYGIDSNNAVIWGEKHTIHIDDFDAWCAEKMAPDLGGLPQFAAAYAQAKTDAAGKSLLDAMAVFQVGIGHISTYQNAVGTVAVE